jgi:hypothetical protein
MDAWQKNTLRNGSTRWKCGPCNRRKSRETTGLSEELRPALRLLRSARRRANQQSLAFNLTVEDIEDVWPADGRCPILRMPMEQGRGSFHDGSPTLDQLDPAFGYEADNIAVISFAANRAKGNLSLEELERLVAYVKSHNGKHRHPNEER